MATSGRPLSPAEISALEHAFASEPGSDAYRPLTEAYLGAGRFMEAMVVCKKGVKAHPDDPSARVLLARVHAAQGKDRKALEEVGAVLAAFPNFVAANLLAATLHLRLGERDAGEAALRRAAEAAPDDPEVRDLLAKHGIVFAQARPSPAAPAAAAPVGSPPVAPRVAVPGAVAVAAAAAPAPARASAPSAPTPAPEPSVDVPIPTPAPTRRQQDLAYAEELARKYGTQAFHLPDAAKKAPARKGHWALLSTLGLAAVLGVALGGWQLWRVSQKEKAATVARLLKDVVDEVDRDAYPAYQDARKNAQQILSADPASQAGHAYLAYADALLWAEHGEGDELKKEAVQHLEAGLRSGEHGRLIAAEAYLKARGGDVAGARSGLEAILARPEVQSPFLTAVLGAVMIQAGELDAARDALSRAQKANPGDARTAWLTAEQYRRRGDGYELQASGYYDYALRIQKDHVPSVLGKALVLLGRGQADEAGRAADQVLAAPAAASKPQLALAHAIRGSVLAARGKAAEAAAEEAEAAKLDPQNPDLPWLVGVRKLRAGDAAGAVEAFQRAVGLDNRRVALYADLVKAQLAREGGAPQALETLKRAVARLGDHPRLALLLGDAYRAAGDGDLARGQYEKAMALQKPFPDARVALARLYRSQGNTPGALVELTQAIEEYGTGGAGGAAAAYVEMADTERSRSAKPGVLKDLYEKALERDPASCEALWGAGKLEADVGLGEAGRRRLDAYVKSCPSASHVGEASKLLGR